MIFEEIMPYLRNGNKIRRQSWQNDTYWISFNGTKFIPHNVNSASDLPTLDAEDIFSDDWIFLVEEVKSFEVKFDIQSLADKMGIPKQKCAELLADEIMKIFGVV